MLRPVPYWTGAPVPDRASAHAHPRWLNKQTSPPPPGALVQHMLNPDATNVLPPPTHTDAPTHRVQPTLCPHVLLVAVLYVSTRTWSMSPCVADTVWSLSLILSVSQSTLRRVLAKMTDWVMARVSYRSHFFCGERGGAGGSRDRRRRSSSSSSDYKLVCVRAGRAAHTQHKAPHTGRGQLGASV